MLIIWMAEVVKRSMTIALLVTWLAALSASAAPAPSPFSMQVYQPDPSNLVFIVSNTSGAPIRVPTSSYAISGMYEPVSANDWSHYKAAHVGLWLTDDWRYMGTNWFMHMSKQDRLARLAPTDGKPGKSISIPRRLSPLEAEILSSGHASTTFTFQISPESARGYGLSSGYAQTANRSRARQGQPDGAANRGQPGDSETNRTPVAAGPGG